MKFVVVGAGPAGVVAVEALRHLSPYAQITLIGDEPEPPYSRMAIPYLLVKNIDEKGTYLRKQEDHYNKQSINVIHGRVVAVDSNAKKLEMKAGDHVDYDKLLLATGSRPVVLPISGFDNDKVTGCWTLADARTITAGIKPGASVVLIGAGFIGCIILEALVRSEAKLTVIERGSRMVPRMLDETCGSLLEQWCVSKGINVMTESQVEAIEEVDGSSVEVLVNGGRKVTAELVISAVGVRPNAEFLDNSGVKLETGAVIIDQYMQSSVTDIYAAGDVACGKDFSTGKPGVQAIQPTAVEHARVAANNMVAHGSVKHQGAVLMNVLDTLGLISCSYGLWNGVEGGDNSCLIDKENYRYIRLQFDGDCLVGANCLGLTQHVGVLRGLIQGRFNLGKWKDRLMENPLNLMETYLAVNGK